MRRADKIIREAAELPVEERAFVIDSLLKTRAPMDPQIDREWVDAAKRRLAEIRTCAVDPIPGSEVLGRIRVRYSE